ncbi:hypothetical Protein YC6258_04352 [Gynuella sunshinyii YC6258]|uniref:Uncharacterized protein n=1 Tax=Gynuella sunshinyii YC6258 TaxID=1445510 RepID=A0A0C5W118_9GAMM|nr:hypothetical Protein YC6258_04352 [Gynuella sunshinyii YC6258]
MFTRLTVTGKNIDLYNFVFTETNFQGPVRVAISDSYNVTEKYCLIASIDAGCEYSLSFSQAREDHRFEDTQPLLQPE